MTATTVESLAGMAHRIRHHIIELATNSPGAHVGGSMSVTEILTVLFFDGVLKADPADPQWVERDRLIYSKGHASAALYAALAERGYFPVSELASYKQPGSRLAGHPTRDIPGVEWATGSLGHGLPVAVGIALANRHDNLDSRTFVVIGDGECQEGSVWEAAMAAAHYRLDNLVVIVDRNGFQEDGPTEDIMALEPLAEKWSSFGWQVRELDGHDLTELSDALHRLPYTSGQPSCLIARTEKGHGLSFTSNTHLWHYGKFSQQQYQQALAELAGKPDGMVRP